MKKLFALMLSLMMALSLTACSSNSEADETEDTNEVVELDTNVYVALGSDGLDLEALVLPLDDYEYVSIEIDEEKSDYDLSTAGEYTLVVVLTHEDGTTTELSLPLVVDTEEVVEEKVAEQLTAKLTNKELTLETILALSEEDESTTTSTSSSSTSTSSGYSGTGGYVSGTNSGLSTNASAYGLDSSNIWVQEAMKLIGISGLCTVAASLLQSAVLGEDYSINKTTYGYLKSTSWSTISANLQIGDLIYYNGMKSGSSTIASHVAVYLGNGLALHGNWTGGVARIANAYQESISYEIVSYTHTIASDSSSCSSCSVSASSKTAEEVLQNERYNGITDEVCELGWQSLSDDEIEYCILKELTGSWEDWD